MERLPYAQRMRNRAIAITVLILIIVAIVHCSTKDEVAPTAENQETAPAIDSLADTAAFITDFSDTNAFDSIVSENPN